MKILIASAPHADTFGYSMPPPGLLRLGGALRDAGHQPALEDLAHRLATGALEPGDGLAASAARLLEERGRPDLLGLSVMGATLPIALEITRILRGAWPDVPILLGGPGGNGTDTAIIERFPWIDAVVRGEAEVTLVEMADALASGGDPFAADGLTFRGPDGRALKTQDRAMLKDLDQLPDYAWDLVPPIRAYKEVTGEDDGLVPLDSGRGCVYDCSFCPIGRTWSRRSRPLPADRLVREVASLRGIPGAKRAYLCHDIFGADRRHALAFTQGMLDAGVTVPWEVRARADHLDAELLQQMGRAGCDRVLLGIESASPSVRARNQKGMREDIDLLRVVDDCAAAGMTAILSLILGLPGETDEDLDASLTFCAQAALRAGVNLSLHLVNPQPGCALGEEFAAVSKPVEGVPPDMALGAGLSAPERALIEAHPDLFSTWALLPYTDERLRELIWLSLDFAEILMRFPRTFGQLMAMESCGALPLARALRADGRTFESFARERCRGAQPSETLAVEELLTWEIALIRVAARGSLPARPGTYRMNASPFQSRLPLIEWAKFLSLRLAGIPAQPPDLHAEPQTYGVAAPRVAAGQLGGVRTLRIGAGVQRLVEVLTGPDTPPSTIQSLRSSEKTAGAIQNLIRAGVLSQDPQWALQEAPPGDTISS